MKQTYLQGRLFGRGNTSMQAWLAAMAFATAVATLGMPGVAGAQARAMRITATVAERMAVEETEWAIGVIESRAAPRIAAEVAGSIKQIQVDEGDVVSEGDLLAAIDDTAYKLQKAESDADVGRLSAMIRDKELDVERIGKLIAQNLISRDQADQVAAELDALNQERAAARARAAGSAVRLAKSVIRAPVAAEVSIRHIDVGDYVKAGTIAFDLLDVTNLRVSLPLPEYRAPRLRKGQQVRLTSAAADGTAVTAEISDIRPGVNIANRSVIVIVNFTNPGTWRPGASARAELVLERREDAVMVPQTSVVRRPVGDVVYVIKDGTASELLIERGERNGDMIEVRSGLGGGEQIAVDGAGFLTHGVPVDIVEN